MSLGYGSSIVTRGLVFAYDMAFPQNVWDDPTVGKSWKGPPATNNSGMGLYTYWVNSGTGSFSSDDTSMPRRFSNIQVTSAEVTTTGNIHISPGGGTISTGFYTLSVWIYVPGSHSGTGGAFPYFRSQPANTNRGYLRTKDGAYGWNNIPRDQWVRLSYSWDNTAGDTSAYISCYIDNLGDKVYFTAPQVEVGSFATPHINIQTGVSTRSNTQALVDLTGNYTITTNSLVYNSDGSFSFNGSHNMDLNSQNIISGTNPFTIESWTNKTSGTYGAIFGNYGSGYTSGNLWWATAGLYINGSVYHSSYSTTMAGKHHSAVTRDTSGNVRLYRDGVLVSTGVLTASIPSNINFRIGTDVNGTGEALYGDIYAVKVYDRVLSDVEIAQNFNALRGRYGL